MASDPSKPEGDQTVDLKLVDAMSEPETPSDPPMPTFETGPAPRPRDRWRLPAWLFVVTSILFFLVIGWQAQIAGELEARVAGLEEQLERTNALLDARRTHLSEIRGGVQELSERLRGLRTLVDSDPTAGVPERTVTTP